jgi:mono/diheme cytochrome c family protein
MRVMKFISVAIALALLLSFAIAQQANPAQSGATIKHVPITRTPSNSGKEMYNNYCAVCHGKDGKGSGSLGAENPTDRSLVTSQERGWKVSLSARLGRHSRASHCHRSRQPGHAGLGPAVFQHQPGT